MTENDMKPQEIRQDVKSEIESDAIDVSCNGDTTTVELYYHEPEAKPKATRTPFGVMIEIQKPNAERLLARLLDDIEQATSPDRMDVEDKDGFYVVTLTYEDGRSW